MYKPKRLRKKGEKEKWGGGVTGEVADGDGDAADGDEAKIIESIEVGNGLGEGRIPIYYRILRLCRCCDVCVHLLSFSLSNSKITLPLPFFVRQPAPKIRCVLVFGGIWGWAWTST